MNNVYVIKWKYDKDRNLKYYVDEMILSDENIRYFWCRELIYKDRKFYSKRAYASTFSKAGNRVFKTKEEAKKEVLKKQKIYEIKKELKQELERRINDEI